MAALNSNQLVDLGKATSTALIIELEQEARARRDQPAKNGQNSGKPPIYLFANSE